MAHVTLTLRSYLIARGALDSQDSMFIVMEAVDSTALEHPEWPLDEERTWDEWEAWNVEREVTP